VLDGDPAPPPPKGVVCSASCGGPYHKKDIKLIEGVQRGATKLDDGMQDFNYNDRLKMLGLQRLEELRMRSDLIETFKILILSYFLAR